MLDFCAAAAFTSLCKDSHGHSHQIRLFRLGRIIHSLLGYISLGLLFRIPQDFFFPDSYLLIFKPLNLSFYKAHH